MICFFECFLCGEISHFIYFCRIILNNTQDETQKTSNRHWRNYSYCIVTLLAIYYRGNECMDSGTVKSIPILTVYI